MRGRCEINPRDPALTFVLETCIPMKLMNERIISIIAKLPVCPRVHLPSDMEERRDRKPLSPATAIELRTARKEGLLSPALSSKGGEGEGHPPGDGRTPIPRGIRCVVLLLSAAGLISDLSFARAAATNEEVYTFKLDSTGSLIRVGAAPMEVTPDALEGAEKVLAAIEKKDIALAEGAIKFYDHIIPKENLG